MDLPPLQKPYFSNNPKYEKISMIFLIVVAVVSALILVLAWPLTRSVDLAAALHSMLNTPLEVLFRLFTFLGDDQFFMVFFSILIWSVSKSLGFWSAFILLTSATYSNLIKDITLLERPPLEGVVHPPGSYAFPSGHTLTAVTVWPYMAARIKKRGWWIWAVIAVVMIGLSRLVLGYHFPGDVLGGLAFGIPFLLLSLWLSSLFYEKGWLNRFSTPVLLVLSLAVPAFLAAVLPGTDPPKILGYLAGASFGYVIERNNLRSSVKANLLQHLIKILVGVAVLFGIIVGLGGLLPSSVPWLGFTRYALGGVWVTLFAPMLFLYLKLSAKENDENIT